MNNICTCCGAPLNTGYKCTNSDCNQSISNISDVKQFLFGDTEELWKEKYDRLVSGDYGVFEIWGANSEIEGYRGFRRECGTTDVYPSYKEAIEAALEDFPDTE